MQNLQLQIEELRAELKEILDEDTMLKVNELIELELELEENSNI